MPLHGKIVVIRRGGGDGTEFPLTAACLFGRKIDCDIRIQLPQVSKEHCRVDINENKEVVLTNLSSVNPTCINGAPMQQSERLKHGDVFTIIDRSFRFEAPPPPTPKKKRVSTSGKGEAVQVLKEHQGRDSVSSSEKNSASDGSKTTNSVDQIVETATMEATKPRKDTQSPFSELYQMIKQDLDPKSPWKAFGGQGKTPVSRRNSQKPVTPKRAADQEQPLKIPDPTTPAGKEAATSSVATTPKSAQKKRRSSLGQPEAKPQPAPEQVAVCVPQEQATAAETPQRSVTEAVIPATKRHSFSSIQSKPRTPTLTPGKKDAPQTPQKFSADQVVQQLLSNPQSAEKPSKVPKSPKRRSTTIAASPKPEPPAPTIEDPDPAQSAQAVPAQPSQEVKQSPRTSPRANAGQRFKVQDVLREIELSTPAASKNDKPTSSKKRKSGGQDTEMPVPLPKKKRVSFGGQLSPELFDKRLPPDSPLRRGATPSRRSLGSGLGQTPKSLLRRASTIGLVQSLKLGEAILESPKAKGKASPAKMAKTPSPAKKSPKAKTPSPAKKSAPATPSPKRQSPAKADPQTPKGRKSLSPAKVQAKSTPLAAKSPAAKASPAKSPTGATKSPRRSPSPATRAKTPTPSPSRKASSATPKTPSGQRSPSQTATVTGRFSISRISTPSPEAGKEEVAVEMEHTTPKIPLRRSSIKASVKKSTRKSLGKAALEVIRRRSGASRASLKVRATWADIVKLGPTKPQTEVAVKKANPKVKVVKKTVAPKPKTPKPKTPARRLQDHTSTGHANSPATIVVGRAQIRAAQVACGAPKLVPNLVLSNMDRRMDEDLSGVSDIFKTPANNKQRRASTRKSPIPASPLPPASVAELSVMKTPEETGEMVVSPLSVVSTAKCSVRYNSEAVTRLLLDDQEASLVSEETSFIAKETVSTGQDEETSDDASVTQTPKQAAQPAAATCLTGVKRLLKTPKQKAEPLEDLRGKLLKTPKQKAAPVDDMAGIQRIMKTPRVKSAEDIPVVCAPAMKRLVKTPRQKAAEPAEEDLSGVQHLLKTPKQKGEPVEDLVGLKRLMRTPKEKPESVEEDLTGLKELVKTPKTKGNPVQEKFGISKLMKTPRQRGATPVEDMEGLQELLQGPVEPETQTAQLTETKAVELIEAQGVEVQEAVTAPEEETTEALSESAEELDPATEEDKENVCPVEDIQAASKPKEPVDTEAKRELQVKRLSSPLKELSLERALEGSEEPVEAGVAPLPTTKEAQEVCAISQDPSPAEVTQEPEEVLVEQSAAPEPTETPAAGDAPVPEALPVPLSQEEVATPARGRRRKLVDESASTPQASPARAVRRARGPQQLQKEEEVKTTPRRGRKPKQVPEEQQVNEEVVVAAASEPVGVTPPTVEEVKAQEAEVTVEMQEAVSVPVFAAESIELTAASVDKEPMSPVDSMTESAEKTEAQTGLPSSTATDLAQEAPTQPSVADVAGTSQDLPEPTAQEIPAPAKSRRGRKLVEASESAAAVASPSRAVRGRVAKQLQDENTEAKPRRGRRTKQDSTEQTQNHTSEVAVAATSEPVETPAIVMEEAASLEGATVSEAPVAQEESAAAPKTTRGRRGRQTKASAVAETVAVATVEMEVENVAPVADAKEQLEPVAEAALDIEPIAEASAPAAVIEEPAKPVAAKPVRGRRGRQATGQVQEPEETQEGGPKAEVEDQSTAKAPAAVATAKPGRGRRGKQASLEVPEEVETKAGTQPEAVQTSLTEVPQGQPQAKATKAGPRGRKAKQAPVQAEEVPEESTTQTTEKSAQVEEVAKETEPSVEAEDCTLVAEEPVKPAAAKATRGRRGKQAPAKVQEEVAKQSESNTEAEDQIAAKTVDKPAAKAVVRRRGKQAVEAQAEADQSSTTEEPEEKPKPTRSGRGRKTKQEAAAPESEATSEAEPVSELAVPAEVTKEQPAPAVKSGRGRKTKTTAAQVQSEAVEASEAASAPEEPAREAPAKRGRGGRAVRKGKAVESEPSASQADGAETTEDVMSNTTKKSVNWSADLVMTKVIESAEPEAVEAPQKKKSKCSVPATDATEEEPAAEVKQAPKGRTAQRGRGAKKSVPAPAEEEAKTEDPEPVAKPVGRRGRVAATKGPKTQPDEEEPAPASAPAPKRGGKRKAAAEVETEEPVVSAASPPKRKRGKAATPEEPQTAVEAPAAAPAKGKRGVAKKVEEVAEAAPEKSEPPAQAAPKSVRGKRKAPQKPESTQDDVSVSAEDTPKAAPETSRSQGRGRTQKKAAEPVTAPADTVAPARRTRRK